MSVQLSEILALINDILEAVIVIFGAAVVLYNLPRARRDAVTLSFIQLIALVVLAYLAELLVSRAIVPNSAETLLRIQWIGITMVPPALIYLSSTLLSTTGLPPRRRKFIIPFTYLLGIVFLVLVVFTNIVVGPIAPFPDAVVPVLQAGPAILVFTAYFWLVTLASIYNVWRARQRCITRTTRQRMTSTLLAFIAAPLGVFPYLILTGRFAYESVPLWLWPVIILGNLVVSMMFGVLTAHIIYFGASSPDRVVRVRLYKFMARVPLAGSIVLIVYILVSRNSPIFGLPTETALGVSLVVTVMLVEWAIHTYKKPLERLFQLNDDPDVRRIQMLSERLLTTRDLQEFLESILAATCEALRTPTAFVTAVTAEGPQMEAVVGPLAESTNWLENAEIQRLARPPEENDAGVAQVDAFFIWQGYWIRPLYNRKRNLVLGILGIRARAEAPDLNQTEMDVLEKLVRQASYALEDRILQQEVFAAVEGLLPQITALQERRRAATFGGLPVLTQQVAENQLLDDPKFNQMVRDALRDYWGGPRLTGSPLMRLEIVQQAMAEHENNPTRALRAILNNAIELQKPEGERSMTTAEWILYNILELKFVQGQRVRDIARRLAMSESDLYRKQRVAIENVARAITKMERRAANGFNEEENGQPATAVAPSHEQEQG